MKTIASFILITILLIIVFLGGCQCPGSVKTSEMAARTYYQNPDGLRTYIYTE